MNKKQCLYTVEVTHRVFLGACTCCYGTFRKLRLGRSCPPSEKQNSGPIWRCLLTAALLCTHMSARVWVCVIDASLNTDKHARSDIQT